jgi:membrane protein
VFIIFVKMKRNKIIQSKPVKWLYRVTQNVSFPGHKNISLYAVLEFFVRSISKKDIQMRSSALSFTFFLALFPTVIFFFTVIAYLPVKQDHDKILFFISTLIPRSAYETIKETLEDILKHQRGDLLSFGFLSAIYFSTNGFHSLMDSLNKYSHIKETRPFWKQRMVAIGLAFFISILILVSVVMITGASFGIKWLDKKDFIAHGVAKIGLQWLNYFVAGAICLSIVSALFYYAPAKVRKWKFFSPGAIFSCIIILITTTGFSYYVNHFNAYNKVYGSIGVLIVIMMLIYINTFILLLGYELNVAIDSANEHFKKHSEYVANKNKIVMYLDDTINTE